ncbi:MAG: hypothetical protein FD168_1965 [Desulfobulbaceae bacterium]|nr:MAG: hypothetical protein FD168_1965 [Desulfobulbaceae bacterium]
MDILTSAPILLLVVVIVLLALILKKVAGQIDSVAMAARFDNLLRSQERGELKTHEEMARSREELGRMAREQRQEIMAAFATFGASVTQRMTDVSGFQKGQLDLFSEQLAAFARVSHDRLDGMRAESSTSSKQLRQEVIAALTGIAESSTKTMGELAQVQKVQLEGVSTVIARLAESNDKKLEALRLTVEAKLQAMQVDSARQLDLMRQTVDEKLQGTLEKRLGESFKQVSERLELVHKGLGEMQSLAIGVGDLKKVLTNVKTRGTWGEVQLGALLEQVLHPDQFAVNVATKGNGERVEFAIKLPGQGINAEDVVWLPIDAKFPIEDYQRLIDCQEAGDIAGIELAGRQLENRVKGCAGDICRKYLNPPATTDFAILFLPIEGLFAEVIRRTALVELIQRQFRVVIAGPTTLWSILNSLQMGFRTLAIQNRSSEVWNLLAAVKTEWTRYGDVLEAVQKKLQQASETIEKVHVRSRAVGKKLKDVQGLSVSEAATSLALDVFEDDSRSVM